MLRVVNKGSLDAYTIFKNRVKEQYEAGFSIPQIAENWPIPANAVARALFECGYGTRDYVGGTITIDDVLQKN